jgi:hypothetical protein
LNQAIVQLIELLKPAQRIKKPGEYLCAYQIARAWFDNIKEAPTLTRNTDAVSGPQQTNFQSYINEVAPGNLVGQWIIRATVDAIRPHKKSPGHKKGKNLLGR